MWLALLLPGVGRAAALSCTEAAAVAEMAAAIPSGLLLAIGGVESGRTDLSGVRAPWPWTINAGGIGRFFAGADEAVAAVRELHAGGVQSIDIGCFQVNLLFHPDAFVDVAAGFDPLTNALAAARFLASLHAELGGWEAAVAAYHSRTELLGASYRDQVLAAWHGTPMLRPPTPHAAPLIDAGWYRWPGASVPGVHVWGPGALAAAAGLPHVITPASR